MDREMTIEVGNMAVAVGNMARDHFSDSRSTRMDFETNISFGDDDPGRAKLVAENLRKSLSDEFEESRIHVTLVDTNYHVLIEYV